MANGADPALVNYLLSALSAQAPELTPPRALGRYDSLVVAEVHDFLSGDPELWDLMVAADVFIYVGEPGRLFGLLERRIVPGGWLTFTVESAEQGTGVQLLPSLRYAHSLDYIFDLALQHGFTIESVQDAPIRVHDGQPLLGRYWYLRKGTSSSASSLNQ